MTFDKVASLLTRTVLLMSSQPDHIKTYNYGSNCGRFYFLRSFVNNNDITTAAAATAGNFFLLSVSHLVKYSRSGLSIGEI